MGGHALFNLVDLWIVGSLGPEALAAVTIASIVNAVPMVLLQGVSEGSVAVIARAVGAGDMERAGRAAREAILFALLLGVVLGVPPWLWAGDLAGAFGAHGEERALATECLQVLSLGSVTMFVLMQAGAALRALGGAKAPAILLVGANMLNVLLAIGLVHGRFGMPELGVVGACWGTVLARGLWAGIGLLLLGRSPLALRIPGPWPDLARVRTLLALGLPVSAQWCVRLVPVLVVLHVTGTLGTEAHAAFGIGSRLDQFAIFACAGWGAAAATATGQGLGARDPRGAARAAWTAAGWGVLWMAMVGVAFYGFAPDLVRLVGREGGASPEVIALGAEYLRIAVLAYPAIGVAVILSMALAGAGSVKTALALEGAALLGGQTTLVLAVAPDGPGGDLRPVWWAVVATYGMLAVAYVGVFSWGRWKSKVIH
jgi:putative MATE family efflux protein